MSYQLHTPWSTASHTMRAANQHHSLLPHTLATLAGFQIFEVACIAWQPAVWDDWPQCEAELDDP